MKLVATISSKYRVVIPRKIRALYSLKPGQKVAFVPYNRSLRLVFVPEIKAAYGFLAGIDTHIDRDTDERG